MSKVEGAGSCPARGRRYSAGQRKEILEFAAEHGHAAAVGKYGCSQWLIGNWRKKAAEATKRREEGVGSSAEPGARSPGSKGIPASWRRPSTSGAPPDTTVDNVQVVDCGEWR